MRRFGHSQLQALPCQGRDGASVKFFGQEKVDPIIHPLTNSKLVLRGLRRLYCNDLLNLPKIRHAMGLRQTCKTSQLRNYRSKKMMVIHGFVHGCLVIGTWACQQRLLTKDPQFCFQTFELFEHELSPGS